MTIWLKDIDSIARMRSYTDLLEKISALMRRHVISAQAEHSKLYADMLAESPLEPRECPANYLGLPKGTKLFGMILPALGIQFAEIKGTFRMISVIDSSR